MPIKSKDLTGQRYGRLVVLEQVGRNKHSHILWKCACDCGNFATTTTSQLGRRKNSCGCLKKNSPLLVQKKSGSDSPFWTGIGEISGYRLNKIKKSADYRELKYEIRDVFLWSLFLDQERSCALSGVPIEFGKKGAELGTASLDRIDSSAGYVEGNVQWVHKMVNQMKMDMKQEDFLDFCKKITDNSKR
jgi:hypothetical protein